MSEPRPGPRPEARSEEHLDLLAPGPVPDLNGAISSPIGWCVLASISERLFELNDRGLPEPNLVSSYTVSGNGTIYRFQIHSGRTFHNGEEVTSEDVIHSLVSAGERCPEGARLFDLAEVTRDGGTGLRRVSRYRFELVLRDRAEGLLSYLALPANSIRWRGGSQDGLDVYSGPYRVEKHDPLEWALAIDRAHPAAGAQSFDRILLRCPGAGDEPPDMDALVLGGSPPGSVAAAHGSSAALFGGPFPLPSRAAAGWRDRLVRLPGDHFFHLRLRTGLPSPESLVRALRQALESPTVHKGFYGVMTPTFIPAAPSGPLDRAWAAGRPGAVSEPVVAVEPGALRPDFLEVLATECRARGNPVRFVVGPAEDVAEGCHAYLRSTFVGHSLDELGFLRRLTAESLPGCRTPGRSFLLGLTSASRAPLTSARLDAIRHLAGQIGPELGVVPLFQAAAGLLVDARIDRESLRSSGGFSSFASLRRRSARFDRAELNQAMLTALGSATQMFAHDVRRPFSMVRILLDMIRSAGSLAEVKETAARMMPDIERALGAVNGMIQDILEIGTAREPVREVAAPDQVLSAALREVFETRPGAEVRFFYEFSHRHPFHVSQHQVQRVFANILSNAVEAMQNRGEIRCRTEDVIAGGRPFVLVSIANNGSRIAPEDLPRVFDVFFSKGKQGGTGLGLAISRKVVEAHEGRIWCISDSAEGVRFCFTLPAHESESRRPARLPADSREIVEEYQKRTALSLSEDERRALSREKSLAGNLQAFREANHRRLRMWVVDDEAIYAEGIRSLIKDAFWFEENVEVLSISDEAGVHQALEQGAPDACICDIDLGPSSADGFAVARELRRRGVRGLIYIHSNRSVPADYRAAIEAGADAYLPKPMSRPHLLRLLTETTTENAARRHEAQECEPGAGPESPMEERRPTLVVIDDEIFMRKAWNDRVDDARVLTYRGPADFRAGREAGAVRWEEIDCIITDYHFGPGEEPLAAFLRGLRDDGYEGPVLLSSNTTEAEEIADWIDCRIEKHPVPWREIREILRGGRP